MPVGRPTVMTPEIVSKLEDAFLMGCTDVEACLYAGINRMTLHRYQEKTEGYSDRKEMLKTNPILQAKRIQKKDLDEDSSAIAQKVIDRKEGTKVAVTGKDGERLFDTMEQIDARLAALAAKSVEG